MISHKLKCIFIHIPRTAGSSIEKSLVGKDWWNIDKETKHLIASQAKKIYSEYWESYFKFSFVRDPYSRMLSLATYNSMRKVYYNDIDMFNGIVSDKHIQEYKNLFGNPLIEYDYRFYKRGDVETQNHQTDCVYNNILDEPLDYIGRFEKLEEDFYNLCNILEVKRKKLEKIGCKPHNNSLSSDARLLITELYEKDFSKFNYDRK